MKSETPHSALLLRANLRHWKKEKRKYQRIVDKFKKYKGTKDFRASHYKFGARELKRSNKLVIDINNALDKLTC